MIWFYYLFSYYVWADNVLQENHQRTEHVDFYFVADSSAAVLQRNFINSRLFPLYVVHEQRRVSCVSRYFEVLTVCMN